MEAITTMTKDQAIKQGYAEQVAAVDAVNCDFATRINPDPSLVEFHAHHKFTDPQGADWTLTAVYLQDKDDVSKSDALDDLDWTVDHYELS